MKKVGVISDTHSYVDNKIVDYLKDSDIILHAGDVGNIEVINRLQEIGQVKAVYGNIDGQDIRIEYPEIEIYTIEKVKIMMVHIGGYPDNYAPKIRQLLKKEKPDIFISGHSHILKVIYDKKLSLLHINPGAVGKSGFHKVRTIIRFEVDNKEIKNLEIIELPRNG